MIMMCQCRLINCNKCSIMVGDVDDWADSACVGTEHMENPGTFS